MNIGEYEFRVGDEVITSYGEKGRVIDICECESCRRRGFLEPIWEDDDLDEHWITDTDAKNGFDCFYRIGKYTFGNLDRCSVELNITHFERLLTMYKKQLQVIEELTREEGVTHEEEN